MRKSVKLTIAVAALTFAAIQFIPAHRTNRLGAGDPDASREVMYVLRRSCYDCHSTESRWPVWAYVAPMSWKVVADVDRARAHVNFSDWAALDPARRHVTRVLVAKAVVDHRMPAWYYLTLHPDARLSDADRALLAEWARTSTIDGHPLPAPADSAVQR